MTQNNANLRFYCSACPAVILPDDRVEKFNCPYCQEPMQKRETNPVYVVEDENNFKAVKAKFNGYYHPDNYQRVKFHGEDWEY